MAVSTLSAPIRRTLTRVDRRIGRVRAAAGLGLVMLAGSVIAVLGMMADFAWPLAGPTRWAMWGSWIGLLVFLFLARVAWPLIGARRRPVELAALAERADPTLGDRLSATVELVGDRAPHGAPLLIDALARQTEQEVGGLDLRRSVSGRRAWWHLAVGGSAFLLVIAPALLGPEPFAHMARRFLMPWADVPRVAPYVVSVRPGDVWLTRGDDVAITASIAPRFAWFGGAPAEAAIEWTGSGTKRVRWLPMERGPDGTFAATLAELEESGTYRVVSRPTHSGLFGTFVRNPPTIRALQAQVTPPDYTKLTATLIADPTWIEAWQDSRVVLTIETDGALSEASVTWPIEAAEPPVADVASTTGGSRPPLAKPLPLTRSDSSGRRWGATLPATATGSYTIALRSAEGISSREEAARRVEVQVDKPPRVEMSRGPEAPSDAPRPTSATESIRLAVAASDDFAVATADLHATIHRAAAPAAEPETLVQPLTIEGLGTPEARGLADLELAPLALGPGDVVSYRIRVTDILPPPRGPNVAWSDDRDLGIVADQDEKLAARDDEARSTLQAGLDALKKAAANERKQAEQLRYAADAARRGNGKWDEAKAAALDEREAAARDLGDQLQLFADDLGARPDFAALAEPTRNIADLEAEAARQALDRARATDDPSRRLAELKQADGAIAAVQNRLEELQRRFDVQARLAEARRELGELAGRQDRLADRAAELAESAENGPADRARSDKLRAEQEEVRRELDELLQKSPTLKAEMLVDQVERAEALSEKIRALADRQVERTRELDDPSSIDPALRELAAEQEGLESDTRRLALRVDPALDESGLPRVNAAAARRPAEPLRRGDPDDARQRMEESERELGRLARDLDGLDDDPKSIARRLARRQQEERDQVAEALGEERHKAEVSPDEAKALAERLGPLAARQRGLRELAAALADRVPEAQRELARQLADRAAEAAKSLDDPSRPNRVDGPLGQARDLAHRLADELPDANRRRGEAQNKLKEARQRVDQVIDDARIALRETLPQPGQPQGGNQTAQVLAERLKGLAERADEAAVLLDELPVDPDQAARRDRAAARARRLAEALRLGRREPMEALMVDARAAVERLGQGVDGLTPADGLADELAAEMALPDADSDRIAAAIRALDVPDASHIRDATARAVESGDDGADAVTALADTLNDRLDAAGRVALLAELQGRVAGADTPIDAAESQRRIAEDLARIDLPFEVLAPAVNAVGRAVELTERAASLSTDPNAPGPPSPSALASARSDATLALERLASSIEREQVPVAEAAAGPAPSVDSELTVEAEQVDESRNLLVRQRRLRESLQAALADQIPPQREIRANARALAGEVADLRREMGELAPGGRGPADAVADLLGNHAPRSMAEAIDRLTRPSIREARDAQRRSADTLERAAQEAAQMARSVRSDLAAADPSGAAAQRAEQAAAEPAEGQGGKPDASELARARRELEASRKLLEQARESGAGASPDAAQAMRRAAEDLRAAASPPVDADGALLAELGAPTPTNEPTDMEAPGDPSDAAPGNPERASLDPKDGPAGRAEPDLGQLQAAVRAQTGRSWGELPGHLRTEILQMARGRYRDDYARLIRLYFREIASAGSRPAAAPEATP